MTSNTKKPISKAKRTLTSNAPNKVEQLITTLRERGFDVRKLLAIPLLCLAVYCVYTTATDIDMNSFSQLIQSPFNLLFPPFLTIFIGTFSCLAIYMLIRGKSIGKIVTGVTWIFTIAFAWIAIAWSNYNNATSDPSAIAGEFQAYGLFLNPFSLGLFILLSIIGIVIMTKRLKKQR